MGFYWGFLPQVKLPSPPERSGGAGHRLESRLVGGIRSPQLSESKTPYSVNRVIVSAVLVNVGGQFILLPYL